MEFEKQINHENPNFKVQITSKLTKINPLDLKKI